MREHKIIGDLNHVRLFAKIAELGSLTRAAKALGKPKSTVSRDLARLEASVGASLMRRSNRRVTLTETGALFLQHAHRILGEVEDAEIAVGRLGAVPRGLLRVSAPFTAGHALLAPLLPGFLERYPEIRFALELDNRRVDPVGEDFDVVLRVGRLEDSSLVARKLAHIEFGLFASPAYLQRRGTPSRLADLSAHDIVDKGGPPGPRTWRIESRDGPVSVEVNPRLSINDPATVRVTLLGGVGIGWLPTFLAAADVEAQHLVPVLADHRRDATDIHALFRARRSLSPAVNAFIDYLVARFSDQHANGPAVWAEPSGPPVPMHDRRR